MGSCVSAVPWPIPVHVFACVCACMRVCVYIAFGCIHVSTRMHVCTSVYAYNLPVCPPLFLSLSPSPTPRSLSNLSFSHTHHDTKTHTRTYIHTSMYRDAEIYLPMHAHEDPGTRRGMASRDLSLLEAALTGLARRMVIRTCIRIYMHAHVKACTHAHMHARIVVLWIVIYGVFACVRVYE